MPSLQSKQIYKGIIYIKKTILFLINVNEPLIDEETLNSSSTMLALDNANGGIYDIETFAELPSQFAQYVYQKQFNFIPTYSSLDVGSGNEAITPNDLTKQYSPSLPPPAPRNIPFNNFFTNPKTSEPHIQFTKNNGDWLVHELENNPEIASCLAFCSNAQLSGSTQLCSTGVYSVTNQAAYTSWYITEGSSLVSMSVSGNQATITQLNPGRSGYVTLNAVYGNAQCGSASVSKRIWVGRPNVQDQNIYGGYDNVPKNSQSTFYVNPVPGATEYYWTIYTNSNSCGCTVDNDGLIHCPPGTILPTFSGNNSNSFTTSSTSVSVNWGNCIGTYTVNCIAKNACGEDGIYYKVVDVFNPNGGGGGGGSNPCEGELIVYPNPINPNGGSGDFFINVVYPDDPCEYQQNSLRTTSSNQITIYDFFGNVVYTHQYTTDQFNIKGINLPKGHYVVHVITKKGYTKKQIIRVE